MSANWKDWESKKILITGATGMVGSWLVKELLKRKSIVVALVRDIDYQTEFYRSGDYLCTAIVNGTLDDFSTVARAINEYEIDTVFHLGAQTIVGAAYREPLQTFESNIRGTYHILEACRQHRDLVERIVIASSDTGGLHPIDRRVDSSVPLFFFYYIKRDSKLNPSCTHLAFPRKFTLMLIMSIDELFLLVIQTIKVWDKDNALALANVTLNVCTTTKVVIGEMLIIFAISSDIIPTVCSILR